MKIVIDAGHGPDTPGKRCPDDSMREYQFNAATAAGLMQQLTNYGDVQILFTHSSDEDVPLSTRTNQANQWGADLFISIHANASGSDWSEARGIETYVYTTQPPAAIKIANAVQQQLVRTTGLANRGVKAADFHVLRETNMTAILIECGFMTNREEAELLKSPAYRERCASAICEAVAAIYNLQEKEENTMADTSQEVLQQQLSELSDQLTCLRAENKELSSQVELLNSQHSMPVPQWADQAVQHAIAQGLVDTPDGGSYDFYRLLTVLYRKGLL